MPELSKTYTPAEVEERWYQQWLDDKCFVADPARVSEKRPAYSIVIPPPNVTGILTLGHVLNNTIQDILCRRARMQGKEVLWLPGTDHAGIATQNVVEKTLKKQGAIKHRDDLGREGLVEKIWEWKEKHGGIIIQQLKKLGASCDWSRERFTMDPEYSRCVQRVFVDLYKKGLIYRGKRMVNWCPSSLTALSDEEVTMKQQNGFMYHFKVQVVEEPDTWLTIATTRPETIPGDTAVAVNPNDERYKHLIGKHIRRPLPLENQAAIPIVADDHVDFEFGTGVLKVTPAHDKADYEIGLRHGLEIIDVLRPNGVLNELAGKDLAGIERFEGRKKAVELLKEMEAFVKEEPHSNNVGYSERADVPIEARLSEQWFLKYPAVQESRDVVADGDMRFYPDRWAKVYDHWLEGIQDWCISRQIWWGHRVPVWTLACEVVTQQGEFIWEQSEVFGHLTQWLVETGLTDHVFVQSTPSSPNEIHILTTSTEADGKLGELAQLLAKANMKEDEAYGEKYPIGPHLVQMISSLEQDPDVLDTWFSSWLWPFATMGWPNETSELKAFYPTTDLVTGPDIIFFWVARMIMAGYEWMGEMPFKNVYFTGIIRDKQGRKMSKSLGNSPDPLEIIANYSADALRFGIMRSAPLGQDILFDEKNVELGRNFCTKLWNACRFRQMQGGVTDVSTEGDPPSSEGTRAGRPRYESEAEIDSALLSSDDKWILLRLSAAISEVSTALDQYLFSDATQTLYRFFWSEYCDWYVEASKATLQGTDEKRKANTVAVIDFVLGQVLRLFHPFLPFITEELWHGMGYSADMPADQGGKSIMFAPWPKPLDADEMAYFGLLPEDEQAASNKYETVNLGRGLKSTFNLSSKRVRFVLKPNTELPAHEIEVLRLLLNAEPLEVDTTFTGKQGTPVAITPLGELYMPLEGLIDVEAERARLGKERSKVSDELAKVQAKLADENFTSKVPQKVLDDHKQREADWQEKLAKLEEMMKALE
ncbi:MAG: valS [Verrucomicrobiaceae bacterium]|nr:valS [Verrucomicrobiaceae bacterium]